MKHFHSFKYPPHSPEGKEFSHLAHNPLQLNDYQREYSTTEKRARNRYKEQPSEFNTLQPAGETV